MRSNSVSRHCFLPPQIPLSSLSAALKMDEIYQPPAVDESLDRKHAAMLERLSNRHHSRLKPESASASAFESTQSFLTRFSQSKLAIESRLSGIRQNPDPARKPDLESTSLEISALEKLVAENSYFLPPFEVRTSLSAIEQLKQSVDDVTSLVIPKKRFSFRNKSSRKATAAVPDQREVAAVPKLGFTDLKSGPGFRNRENEALAKEFNSSDPECQNGEFTLSNLINCEVRLKGRLRALFVDKLKNCKVYIGAVMGSVLIEGAQDCVFVLGSHQIRIHNAESCDFYLQVRSRPIIEDSTGVRFGPYCLSYKGLAKDLEEANLGEENENWMNVDDLWWLRAVQSPNWSVLPEIERLGMVDISYVENDG